MQQAPGGGIPGGTGRGGLPGRVSPATYQRREEGFPVTITGQGTRFLHPRPEPMAVGNGMMRTTGQPRQRLKPGLAVTDPQGVCIDLHAAGLMP